MWPPLPAPSAALASFGLFGKPNIKYGRWSMLWAQFAIDETQAVYVATQREIKRIEQLEMGPRAFQWEVLNAPLPYTDQLLYAGLPANGNDDEDYQKIREHFVNYLLTDEAQQELTRCAVFSVLDDVRLYSGVKGMEFIEKTLASDDLLVPNAFDYSFSTAPRDIEGAASYLEGLQSRYHPERDEES
jgi:hypothetical protein